MAAALALVAGATSTPGKYFGVDSHVDSECLNKDAPDKYLVLVHAHEQMNKNIAVVAEVASSYCRPITVGTPSGLRVEPKTGMGKHTDAWQDFVIQVKRVEVLASQAY